MTISISTGCCFDLKLTRLESIHFLEKYSSLIDGVELLFATPKELIEFELDAKSKNFLKSKQFVTIHMPFDEVEYKNDKTTEELIEKTENLSKEIKINYILFHPNKVTNFDSLKSTIPIVIENMNKKLEETGYTTVKEMKRLFDKYPDFGFVLDTSHTLGNNINPIDFLILKNKLKGIHSSGQWIKKGNLKEHGFLIEGEKEQLEKLKPVLELNVPKVIECDFYPKKVPLIEQEIQLIKQLEKH